MLKPVTNSENHINHGNHRNGNIFIFIFLLFALSNFVLTNSVSASQPVSSEQDDLPVNIQSDSANFDEQKGIALYKGHVSVQQGDRFLTADNLKIYRNKEGKIHFIEAKGHPASFEASPDTQKPKIHGKANTLKYFPKENKIILMDEAELIQDDKTLQAALITYHFENQTLVSDSLENQRTTIILQRGE